MEPGDYVNLINSEQSAAWYTEEFILNSLVAFLKKNSYKIHEDKLKDATIKSEKILVVSKFFTKEIIGIKGFQSAPDRDSLLKVFDKNNDSPQVKSWFYDSLFHSLINFGKFYSNENAVGAMALPNVEKYRVIINRIQTYFNSNHLHFKLYMINESGEVDVLNINDK